MVEEDFVDMARELMDKAEARGVKILLPKDVVVADSFAADAATKVVSIRPSCPDIHLRSSKWVGEPTQICCTTKSTITPAKQSSKCVKIGVDSNVLI